jgi:peptidoglycan/xylan/chitin deacetylase (PgdA/CDA1 family)
VTDASGNTTQVSRKIEYTDPIPPEITLLGQAHMMLQLHKPYEEAGFTAMDNCDGDLTQKVTVSGDVDTGKAGIYVLTYLVEDSYGNVATAQRTVFVSAQPPVPGVPHTQYETPLPDNGKVIYLTFDDGPSVYTKELLDVLAKYNAKATFFVVGTNAAVRTGDLKSIVEGGHSVALHSMTHEFSKIYVNEDAFLEDIYDLQALIYENTGVTTTLLRFPGGTSNTISKNYCKGIMTQLVKTVTDLGFQYFDWNVDSNDAGGAKTADEVYRNVINGIGNMKKAYVLMHDTKGYSVDAVERIIQWGLENGYSFQALTSSSPAYHHGVNN